MESTVYSTAVGDNDYLNDKELRQLFHTSELEAFNARLKTHPVLEWKEKILNQTFDMVAKSKNPHEKKRQQLREQM